MAVGLPGWLAPSVGGHTVGSVVAWLGSYAPSFGFQLRYIERHRRAEVFHILSIFTASEIPTFSDLDVKTRRCGLSALRTGCKDCRDQRLRT